ncbi:YdhR family protein [Paenarthrobacter nitroguajacolicus]|uniref:YdhR family protein n=1 Tax=Paenarthrobacter nitroguajacolicus TaxID=211146 RepID=UPI00341D011D
MKLLQVKYGRALAKDDNEQAERLMQSAIKIAGVRGLLWKIWIYDDEERTAGGIYLFDSEENARIWGDEVMEKSLKSHPGISGITKHYFDIDEDLTRRTRGPIAVVAG